MDKEQRQELWEQEEAIAETVAKQIRPESLTQGKKTWDGRAA